MDSTNFLHMSFWLALCTFVNALIYMILCNLLIRHFDRGRISGNWTLSWEKTRKFLDRARIAFLVLAVLNAVASLADFLMPYDPTPANNLVLYRIGILLLISVAVIYERSLSVTEHWAQYCQVRDNQRPDK
jgi:hypothetical protein